ncbi:PREDICTED: uncharacterized protein LOC108559823 [Nicrophorus vespilloides]|uniref:Uncharacterized protein LOC108559823 n=1 Tax=Nicrophorus vespilloides TaxID=110193 RepID=A0ABM1MDL9_NICVS|nr:PREDICTED: uncharacterized protein LOC108559823 [Nicrophorus vespilloides]
MTSSFKKSYGTRKVSTCVDDYYNLVHVKKPNILLKKSEDNAKLIKYIDDNIIGKNNTFLGPFGRRKVVFSDYVASGRSLHFIEEYIIREVLPCYGNTHFNTNITSLQSTLFRQEAREIIKTAVNASEDDAVIFVGQGCSGAVKKLVKALDFNEPPIVFVGASEHQDNIQIWQDLNATIIRIAETKQNFLDLNDLDDELKLYQHSNRQLIGCFSATSNVTGILVDDIAATMLLHQYGALAFWDYNLAAPYVPLNMNPKVPGVADGNVVFKDAIYFSGHKFIGGVQTPGILVAKKSLFHHVTPCESDGFFTLYEPCKSFELQEEGTSAAIIESVRAGLVMQLKETVTVNNIGSRHEKITKQMLQHIRTIPEIILLGNSSPGLKRIPVFSFMVRHPRATFLHHNFVCAVLNDVFGIQARGGCLCSGAYAQDLLNIDDNLANQYENFILEDRRLKRLNLSKDNSPLQLLRPGFVRISLPYFISENELAFIMEAIKMVATEGWKLLPQYVVDLNTGVWRHHSHHMAKDRKWLNSIRYIDGKMTMNERRISGTGHFPQNYSECLQTARDLFNKARRIAIRKPFSNAPIVYDSRSEKLRWFMLQHEAQDILVGNSQNIKHTVPFNPLGFSGSRRFLNNKTNVQPQIASNASSPRHYSLPSIDDHRLLSCSSPVPYLIQDNLYYTTQTPVNFSVGEAVGTSQVLTSLPQSPLFFRDRCYSLGTPTLANTQNVLSPQTRLNLGLGDNNARRRNYSCSSANDFLSFESEAMSPTHSLNIVGSFTDAERGSPADLESYVTEITKELATNIKSEIREVINKVEDALENTDNFEISYDRQQSSNDPERNSINTANEIAQYLEKVSKEMANEVKSEIRDVVSAVDFYFTPEKKMYSSSPTLEYDSDKFLLEMSSVVCGETNVHKTDKMNIKNTKDQKTSQNIVASNTITSLNSQDSGINLLFQESQEKIQLNKVDGNLVRKVKSTWACPPVNIWQPSVDALDKFQMIRNGDRVMVCISGTHDSLTLLHTLLNYQNVVSNKGISFSVGAVSVNPESNGCDPCILIPHLKSLGVPYILDDHSPITEDNGASSEKDDNCFSFGNHELRSRLYATAKSGGYNVLAIGQHLDDLVENLLISIFYNGKLSTLKAHYNIKKFDLRIIRPLIYVRERSLRDFAICQNFPKLKMKSIPTKFEISEQRQMIKQMLQQQESVLPKLFDNIKNSFHMIMLKSMIDEEEANVLDFNDI